MSECQGCVFYGLHHDEPITNELHCCWTYEDYPLDYSCPPCENAEIDPEDI